MKAFQEGNLKGHLGQSIGLTTDNKEVKAVAGIFTEEGNQTTVGRKTTLEGAALHDKETWVSKDITVHGGSCWKIFKETGSGLEWIGDLDEYGQLIQNKHKGSVGKSVPWKELNGVK